MNKDIAVVLLFCALFITQAVFQRLERKDLYNRLMSRDLSEYKRCESSKPEEPRETAHQKAIKKWRNG